MSNYAVYDFNFWNTNVKQVQLDVRLPNSRISERLESTLDRITFGMYERQKWKRKVKRQIKRGDLNEPQKIELDDRLVPIQYEIVNEGGFIINGVNSTDTIKGLSSLTGLPILELEGRMLPDDRTFDQLRPGEYHGSNSDFGGFIKPEESLVGILAKDNDFVLGRGYTHYQLANPLFQILNALVLSDYHKLATLYFNLNGDNYAFLKVGFPMDQDSPFNDGISAPGTNIYLRKFGENSPKNLELETDFLDDGKSFFFAPLHPFLISRYGFYEGNVKYRIEPSKIIDFFQLKPLEQPS